MNRRIKTIAKVPSGDLTLCLECRKYQLSFNNLFFEFTKEELKQFKYYIFDLDVDYWECEYQCPKLKKNIPIPSLQNNLILLFDRREIEELKELLSFGKYNRFRELQLDEIDYKLILN